MAVREREVCDPTLTGEEVGEDVQENVRLEMEYSWWAGKCLGEVIKANLGLSGEQKVQLLELCPPSKREEGRELLEMLPEVARSLAKRRCRRSRVRPPVVSPTESPEMAQR